MMRPLFLIIFLFTLLSAAAQTKNNHIVGLDIGYATWPKMIGYKGEVNFNYFYAFKHFCVKTELGVSPATNFGTLKKVFITLGYTTKLSRFFSYHVTAGLGGIPGNKTYDQDGYNYDFTTSGVVLSHGIFLQLLRDNKLFLGLNMSSTPYFIYPTGELPAAIFDSHSTSGTVIFINLSFNYKLNGKKTETSKTN